MVGRLVEQQQVGLERERQRERGALALAARGALRRLRLVETEAMQEFREPRLDAPARALVGEVAKAAAQHEALAQRRRRRQQRLLLDEHRADAIGALDVAVVERLLTGDHAQQRRLAGAVAADESDALAGADREARRGRAAECRPNASSASRMVRSVIVEG